MEIKSKKATITVDADEEPARFNEEKLGKLRPAFGKDGTVTAGNASTINDGAGAMIVCSEEKARALNIPLEGRILGYAGAATDPDWFTVAPVYALRKLSEKLDLKINEAFSVVTMLALKELNLSHEKVNIFGGAVALGHPIGATGARLITTLLNGLQHTGGKLGVATLCIGGGEALAIAIERC